MVYMKISGNFASGNVAFSNFQDPSQVNYKPKEKPGKSPVLA